MNNPDVRIPEEIATEVLTLASRYYASSTQSYSVSELVQAGSEVQIPAEFIEQAIKRFGDYTAANPQLQSSQLFINLQYEIAGMENRIAVERMRYNKAVQSYNQQIQQFPNSVVAKAFRFKSKSFFQTTTSSAAKTSRP